MMVGSSVGSWRFTLRTLRGLMPILTTYVAVPTERRCGAKLHWRIISVKGMIGTLQRVQDMRKLAEGVVWVRG